MGVGVVCSLTIMKCKRLWIIEQRTTVTVTFTFMERLRTHWVKENYSEFFVITHFI